MIGIEGEPVGITASNDVMRREGGWGLVRVAPNGALSAIPLYDGAILGCARGHGGVIDVGDGALAVQHAQFVVRPDGVYVSDLDTPTGTRLDGVPISMLGLAHGSVLRMGNTLALFVERDLETYVGAPGYVGGEMVAGVRQREWIDPAVAHVRAGRSMVIQGGPGVGKSTLARVAVRASGVQLPVHAFDGVGLEPEQLLHRLEVAGPMIWLIQHIDRIPRAAQADLVRAIRSTEGAMLVATVVGAIEDAQAEGRVGASLMGLVENRTLKVPELEQRREDVPALTIEMLRRMGVSLNHGAESVFEAVLRAGWPGGVRELGAHLAAAFDAGGTAEAAAEILCQSVPRAGVKEPLPLQESDADLARARLRRALDRASGTVAVAARELRMSRQAFYRELRRLDMEGKKRTSTLPSAQ